MDARTSKGMEIAATMPLRRGAKGWIVPSQTGIGTYTVVPHPTTTAKVIRGEVASPEGVQPWRCDCPDFELRNQPCKHVLAVQFVVRRETVELDGSIVTEEMRVTYTQDWTSYNAAQCAEKDMFLPMLADICGTLSRPYSGKGRPSLPISDMAYAAVAKVYTGLSARRFDSDVREAKDRGLTDSDPHYNSVLRYLRDPNMTAALEQLVTLSALPLVGVETDFAMDSTGFSTCTYTRWYDHKWGKEQKRQDWIKLHATTGVRTNVITAVEVNESGGDSLSFRPMLAATAEHFPIREISADKAYSSKANLQAVADLGGTPFIPFREYRAMGKTATDRADAAQGLPGLSSAWAKMYHLFAYQRDTFLSHYHKRSNVEATFSALKRKFGSSLRSKYNEVLCKVIAHNLCVLIAAHFELGIEPHFTAPQIAG